MEAKKKHDNGNGQTKIRSAKTGSGGGAQKGANKVSTCARPNNVIARQAHDYVGTRCAPQLVGSVGPNNRRWLPVTTLRRRAGRA